MFLRQDREGYPTRFTRPLISQRLGGPSHETSVLVDDVPSVRYYANRDRRLFFVIFRLAAGQFFLPGIVPLERQMHLRLDLHLTVLSRQCSLLIL